MRFQVTMIDKEEKTFEETIVIGNMDEAKIGSANWVYK